MHTCMMYAQTHRRTDAHTHTHTHTHTHAHTVTYRLGEYGLWLHDLHGRVVKHLCRGIRALR
jgi:hypothetical protein